MAVSDAAKPFLGLWPTIKAGAEARASTESMFTALRDDETYNRLGPSAERRAAVGELWSLAVRQRVAGERFARAADNQEFTIDHAAPAINMRPDAARLAAPEWKADFTMTLRDETGSEYTRQVSVRDSWLANMTVGDVRDAIREAAEGLSNDYGDALVGVSNIRPQVI